MKNITKYLFGALIFGATSFSLTSCDLDEYNPSGEGADAVFATEQGMQGLVNQMYYNFRWKYYGREDPVLYFEGSADTWQNIAGSYDYGKQLTRCVDLQGNRGQFKTVWERVYDNINTCNAIINRLPNVVGMDKSTVLNFDGEARFMRSYCYWWLVEFFGDIEMRTTETNEAKYTAERTDRKVIYDEVIIPDARLAANQLPIQPYNGDMGRSTKKAAQALLARVLLTRAQYEAAGSAEQKAFYQEALNAANELINNKSAYGVKLYNTYDEIWQAKNNKNNTEYLWVVTHSSNSALNPQAKNPNRLHTYFSPALVNHGGIRTIATSWDYPKEARMLQPTYYFLKLWEDWDLRYDVLFQEEFTTNASRTFRWNAAATLDYKKYKREDLADKRLEPGDKVFEFTKESVADADKIGKSYCVVDIDDVYETENVNSYGGARIRNYKTDTVNTTQYIAQSFPRFKKYRIWDGDENGTILLANATGNVGFADVPVMRYAEVPLIAAECQIGLGNQAAAAQIINAEIRNQRVVKPGHNLSEAQVTASDMTIEWIMEERARELCGEWLRWFDCKRVYGAQGKFASTIVGRNPSMTGDDCMQEYHTLRPIPNAFLDKLENAEEFGQNPGYDPYVRASN